MKKKKIIKAWAVLRNGKLEECKDSWVLPIMLGEVSAKAYSFFHKEEKVVPCKIVF